MLRPILVLAMASASWAFSPSAPGLIRGSVPSLRASQPSATAITMVAEPQTRREAVGVALGAALAALVPGKADAAGLAFGYGANAKDIDQQLKDYGLSPLKKIPDGFKPLIQLVGGAEGANIDGSKTVESIGSILTSNGLSSGQKVLILFDYPSSWLVSLPVLTGNGESGTISANNYVKGDTAAVAAKLCKGSAIADQPKEYFTDLLMQSVPQSAWGNFKLVKKTAAEPIDGQEAFDIEYRYDLITSGLNLGRHGFAKVIKVGDSAVALGATTTDTRFKKMKDDLVNAIQSFRAHIVKAEFATEKAV